MNILGALYLFLPGYFANAIPPLLARVPWLRQWGAPIDCGLSWRNKRLLGENKTWRGAIGAVLIGGLVFLGQRLLAAQGFMLGDAPFSTLPSWYGFLLGAGVIVGDALESFVKRRANIPPGKLWVPFDQIDFTLGGVIATAWVFWPGWSVLAILIVINGLGSALAHYLGYLLGINEEKF
ncbi:CDP-archaeol synthase [Candidatus Woesearchaeota archaeon]|nr:MAG: CDP-archaeol synthase [Candidatus Woesearchaeota archaeon]